MLVEEHVTPFLGAETADVVQHFAAWHTSWNVCIPIQAERACQISVLRLLCQLDVVQLLNDLYPCSRCFWVTALHDGVYMECDEETVLFVVRVNNAFIRQKYCVLYCCCYISMLFCSSGRHERSSSDIKASWWRPGPVPFDGSFSLKVEHAFLLQHSSQHAVSNQAWLSWLTSTAWGKSGFEKRLIRVRDFRGLFTRSAEEWSGTNIGKDVCTYTSLLESRVLNRALSLCIWVETNMEPPKSLRVVNHAGKGPSWSQAPTAAWPQRLIIKLTQAAMERKTVEKVLSDIGDTPTLNCTNLRTELQVLDICTACSLPRGYSVNSAFEKCITHTWILDCCLPPGPRIGNMEHLYKSNSPLLQNCLH